METKRAGVHSEKEPARQSVTAQGMMMLASLELRADSIKKTIEQKTKKIKQAAQYLDRQDDQGSGRQMWSDQQTYGKKYRAHLTVLPAA